MDPIIANIRQFAEKSRSLRDDPMAVEERGDKDLEGSLDATLQELQAQIATASQALEKLRAENVTLSSTEDLENPRLRLRELQAVKLGMASLAAKPPMLPSSASAALPSVLAYQTIKHSIAESKKEIPSLESQISFHEHQLRTSRSLQTDHSDINLALRARIDLLRTSSGKESRKDVRQIAQDRVNAGRALQKHLRSRAASLRAALLEFAEEHLAVQLAAEELGGPVVGDSMEVDEDSLAAGVFGKRKSQPSGKNAEQKRQRRLEDIRGAGPQTAENEVSEKSLAGEEFVALVDALVEALDGRSQDGVYVRLERESAAVRFLVRARVAQFHPKDARRIRLVDFGRELDD
ncbi:hypothetical protein P152DRAFT_62960 [Eremomyces bilateralis CBS 781.70]|uniref:Centromere protein Cenp-K n=1 Tax=Eremomyces bilateralis CBS 781.70 TaxID=1392243 RepID=A0A6G1G018_9PEZI|nr:uncharacterized protein P152DRAFT_62960 [Eremomyces bilateralis CBS 781.70]KAF1811159.1 hypothetical protein P152DRAFT_62960 [Eremomyces bilateralis CBS 781.70]